MMQKFSTAQYFYTGEFPSLHQRKEGWTRDKENIAKHP